MRHSEFCGLVEAIHLGQFSPHCLLAHVQPQYGAEEVGKHCCVTIKQVVVTCS